jgi:hypothetical protein
VAVRTAQLAKVLVRLTHNDFVYLDFSTIAELDSQVGIGPFVKPLAGVHGGQWCVLRREWIGECLVRQKRKERREAMNIK